ncbi:MAG: PASTA domain-containing protein [Acidimicrobiaceae bacterium]|nr:PASTA domain-containing protein [Actinomycetota bacterium]MCB9380472.1 PASTA domain-containing protein [Acidimicrobiaceae bacterium]MCO5329627.1 PASTA domain-containing protein [Ilumatobacteraceae bacterium]
MLCPWRTIGVFRKAVKAAARNFGYVERVSESEIRFRLLQRDREVEFVVDPSQARWLAKNLRRAARSKNPQKSNVIRVPSVDGLTVRDAARQIEAAGLRWEIVNPATDSPSDPTSSDDATVRQSVPLGGMKVRTGDWVLLVIRPKLPDSAELP